MARFKFRLEASLHLAERILEEAEGRLAEELRKRQVQEELTAKQQLCWQEAVAGQREAGKVDPANIGVWQKYAWRQNRLLRQRETELAAQSRVVEARRAEVTLAYQEVEKIKRLKNKKLRAFLLSEQRREEQVLEEAGQLLYWRQHYHIL